jgi:hypothetical protein
MNIVQVRRGATLVSQIDELLRKRIRVDKARSLCSLHGLGCLKELAEIMVSLCAPLVEAKAEDWLGDTILDHLTAEITRLQEEAGALGLTIDDEDIKERHVELRDVLTKITKYGMGAGIIGIMDVNKDVTISGTTAKMASFNEGDYDASPC